MHINLRVYPTLNYILLMLHSKKKKKKLQKKKIRKNNEKFSKNRITQKYSIIFLTHSMNL